METTEASTTTTQKAQEHQLSATETDTRSAELNPSTSPVNDADDTDVKSTTNLNLASAHISEPPPKRTSNWKCILFTLLVFVSLFAILKATQWARKTSSPHRFAYANKTLSEVKYRSAVVQPLLSLKSHTDPSVEQRFDIVATVWARDEPIRESLLIIRPREKVLFEGVVFRDVSMGDVGQVDGVVDFELPLAPFREANLTSYDLRASFVLIPKSPSLLDHVKGVSSWIPAFVDVPPVRVWSSDVERSIYDQAIDSFGISIPLLHLHGIKSRCLSTPMVAPTLAEEEAPEALQKSEALEDDGEDEDEDDSDETRSAPPTGTPVKARKVASSNASVRHPYLITRTQLRLIREPRLYDRKIYNTGHKHLRSKACGQSIPSLKPSWFFCNRAFAATGPFETRFELDMGSKRSEWAYAPFLTTYSKAAGRKDYVPIPVNREDCSSSTQGFNEESMKVNWKISFTTVSPIFHALGEKVVPSTAQFNWTDTELEQRAAQQRSAMYNEFLGHKYQEGGSGVHQFILDIFLSLLGFASTMLNINYWESRKTSFGLSTATYMLISLGMLLPLAVDAYESWGSLTFSSVLAIVLPAWASSGLFVQMKQLSQIDINWDTASTNSVFFPIPVVTFRDNATRREKLSQAVDAKLATSLKIAITLALVVVYWYFEPHNLILHTGTAYIPEALKGSALRQTATSATHALILAGTIFQRLLNHRLRVFAGQHKKAVFVNAAITVVKLAALSPWLMRESGGRLTLDEALMGGLLLAEVWQAVALPEVNQVEQEEHVE